MKDIALKAGVALCALAMFAACAACLFDLASPLEATYLALGALGMSFLLKDAELKGTRALPAAASSTVDGGAIDLGLTSKGDFLANVEFLLSAPAVTTTMAPDTRTFTYSIIHSDNADLSSPAVLYSAVITQTGAGGAGAAAATATVRLPVDVKRYVGIRVVSGASTADASTVSATLEALV